MAQVIIDRPLILEIKKRFNKQDANKILDLMRSLEETPAKGKLLGTVGGLVIKEIKYRNFRFYFVTDGFTLKFYDAGSLSELLIRFVRMSDKKHQQQTINEIKHILKTVGPKGL